MCNKIKVLIVYKYIVQAYIFNVKCNVSFFNSIITRHVYNGITELKQRAERFMHHTVCVI